MTENKTPDRGEAAELADRLEECILESAEHKGDLCGLSLTPNFIRAIVAALRAQPASPGEGGAERVGWLHTFRSNRNGQEFQSDLSFDMKPDPEPGWNWSESEPVFIFAAPPQAEQKCLHGKPIMKWPHVTYTDCEECWKDICAAAPQPAEARTERGEPGPSIAPSERDKAVRAVALEMAERARAEGHAAGFAAGKEASAQLCEHWNTTPGSRLAGEIRKLLQPKEGGR